MDNQFDIDDLIDIISEEETTPPTPSDSAPVPDTEPEEVIDANGEVVILSNDGIETIDGDTSNL